MATTQDHLQIKDIKDDVLILKDGGVAVVLETSAVNFGLLSENEQLAIITAFASLLNSLSFSIQIVIRSKRLDISSYLNLLAEAQAKQTNLLLSKMMSVYRQFIEKTVRENQVLDKQFFIIIPLSYLEIGLTLSNDEAHFKKALTILLPRRDHIIRQLWRTGLKASQLNTAQLINLFYDIYNPPVKTEVAPEVQPANLSAGHEDKQILSQPVQVKPTEQIQPKQELPIKDTPPIKQVVPRSSNLVTPFIVEELPDDYTNLN